MAGDISSNKKSKLGVIPIGSGRFKKLGSAVRIVYFRPDWETDELCGDTSLAKVAAHWAKHMPESDAAGFYTSKLLRPYLVESAFGPGLVAEYGSNPEFAVDAFVDHVLKTEKPIKSILSICCGFGAVERRFACRSCLASRFVSVSTCRKVH